jgi:hypothetical protein
MTLKLDLLKIDMDAGKHWIDRVVEQMAADRLELVRVKARANWLRRHGRDSGAAGIRQAELEAKIAATTSGKR